MSGYAAVVPAAGAGRRFGSRVPKAFAKLGGEVLVVSTLKNLKRCGRFREIVLAVSPEWISAARNILKRSGLGSAKVVAGGRTRAESVRNGVLACDASVEWVYVHDAARPLVAKALVSRLTRGARRTGACIPALPATATVKSARPDGTVLRTVDRERLFLAQTPQVFRRKLLVSRYKALGRKAFRATDEAALFDGTPVRVQIVPGDPKNIKITTPEDGEWYVSRRKKGGWR